MKSRGLVRPSALALVTRHLLQPQQLVSFLISSASQKRRGGAEEELLAQ